MIIGKKNISENIHDMDDYTRLVMSTMTAAKNGDKSVSRIFENSGINHAQIVVQAMISSADKYINIFTENLAIEVYNPDVLRSASARLGKGKIQIVIEDRNCFTNEKSSLYFIQDLITSEDILLKVAPVALRGSSHMVIVDGEHIRFETNHEKREAIVGFGLSTLASKVASTFSLVNQRSKALKI